MTEGINEVSSVLFGLNPVWVASSILALVYLIIFLDKINIAVVTILGASVMIFMGVINQEQAFHGIDFNTLALLTGMMIIVGTAEKSGMFHYAAIWAAKSVRANPRGILLMMGTVTAIFSALLDNVTTVILIVPVTLQMVKDLKVSPYPFLYTIIFASNIGGTATLIGDPPNILIGSATSLSFMDFVYNLGPVVFLIMLALLLVVDFFIGRKMPASLRDRARLIMMHEEDYIEDRELLISSLVVLFCVILGFATAEYTHIENGTIAMFGAAILLLTYSVGRDHYTRSSRVEGAFAHVDWITIFFFAGLFIVVHGVYTTGILDVLALKVLDLTSGSIENTCMAILWISSFVSAAINNIPFVATMIPIIKTMTPELGGKEAAEPLWWALSLGACLGGNGTLIGASANVMVAGMAERRGVPLRFGRFLFYGMIMMIASVIISTVCLYFMFF